MIPGAVFACGLGLILGVPGGWLVCSWVLHVRIDADARRIEHLRELLHDRGAELDRLGELARARLRRLLAIQSRVRELGLKLRAIQATTDCFCTGLVWEHLSVPRYRAAELAQQIESLAQGLDGPETVSTLPPSGGAAGQPSPEPSRGGAAPASSSQALGHEGAPSDPRGATSRGQLVGGAEPTDQPRGLGSEPLAQADEGGGKPPRPAAGPCAPSSSSWREEGGGVRRILRHLLDRLRVLRGREGGGR